MIGSNLKTIRAASLFTACLALTVFSFAGKNASAQDSWSLRLSEKEGELEHTGDPMWSKWLMWDIGYQRMVDRNMPYIEIMNAATSVDPITQFHLTIGDNRFNFAPVTGSNVAVVGSTTPTAVVNGSTTNNGDELVVNFGNGGILPGQIARFKIKLGVDPSFAATYAASFGSSLPDYRTVLFDMNGINVYDGFKVNNSSADNATASVVFDTNIQSNKNTFPDETVPNGQFFNNIIRNYSQTDMVNLFELQGAVVPEPTGIGLAMMGIAALVLRRNSRTRLVG
jgi:hypothetical protein